MMPQSCSASTMSLASTDNCRKRPAETSKQKAAMIPVLISGLKGVLH
jgi:hypothetical protein